MMKLETAMKREERGGRRFIGTEEGQDSLRTLWVYLRFQSCFWMPDRHKAYPFQDYKQCKS